MTNLQDVGSITVLAGLDPAALQDCASLALQRTLAPGRHVFSQGEPGARFHAVVSGCVRVSQSGADGTHALLRFVGAGEPFGSFGIFVDGCYPAEAIAVVQSVELSWSEAQFRSLMDRYPAIAVNLLQVAGRRLRELQDRLREMATQTAEQRIASALLRLAAKDGLLKASARTAEIVWPLSRRDVAAVSGTTIYTSSRIMADWQRRGIVDSAQKRIRVLSVDELAAIAEGASHTV